VSASESEGDLPDQEGRKEDLTDRKGEEGDLPDRAEDNSKAQKSRDVKFYAEFSRKLQAEFERIDEQELTKTAHEQGHAEDGKGEENESNEGASIRDEAEETEETNSAPNVGCNSQQNAVDNHRTGPDLGIDPDNENVSQPSNVTLMENVEQENSIYDTDATKATSNDVNCETGSSKGVEEERERSDGDDCVSTHSTKDYNGHTDVDECDEDVDRKTVKEGESLVSRSDQSSSSPSSSILKSEKSSTPSPYYKFRTHYERLEQMSQIEVLGFFRRFVTAMIVYEGTGASPLVDWEDATLRPRFYPPWLPWLDPDAKPDGFEDCVWTALLKEGLKFMFHGVKL